MYDRDMIITNDTGTYEVWGTEAMNQSSDLVVGSESLTSLEQMLDSLELAGVSDDHTRPKDYFKGLSETIKQRVLPSEKLGYVLILDRASFCLWMNFEVLNYLMYDYTGYKDGYITA